MKKYILDTNICIYFLRGREQVAIEISKVGVENCFISEMTVAELLYGVECSSQNKDANRQLVEKFISDAQVLSISNAIPVYAREKALLRRSGTLIDDMDILIGSTAIANSMILVTDNEKHLKRLSGINIENWIVR
jgi:tRNA(fMet)-specific endonuclease VapC